MGAVLKRTNGSWSLALRDHSQLGSFRCMKSHDARRKLVILFIAAIMVSCTASAILGLNDGHTVRSVSEFFAGLAFSALIWTRKVVR